MNHPSTSSGLKTATATISEAPGILRGVCLIGNSLGDGTLTVYDNTSDSGLVIAKIALEAGQRYVEFISEQVTVNKGIHAVLTTAAGELEYIILYNKG